MIDLNNKVAQGILRICEENGNTKEVDSSFYEEFFNLSERQLATMARIIFSEQSLDIRQIVAKSATSTDPLDTVTTFLELIFRGIVGIRKDGGLGFVAPIGPPPTPEMEQRFEERIRQSRSTLQKAYFDVLEREAAS